MAPHVFAGRVEKTPVLGSPVLVPPGAATSVGPWPQFEYEAYCF